MHEQVGRCCGVVCVLAVVAQGSQRKLHNAHCGSATRLVVGFGCVSEAAAVWPAGHRKVDVLDTGLRQAGCMLTIKI